MNESRFPALLLWIDCILFVGFGAGFLAAPLELADLVLGAATSEPSAIIDMRATYGGFSIGAGFFFGLCAGRREWLRPGLVMSVLAISGIGAARIVGLIADGQPNAFMILFLAFEIAAVALTTTALRRVGADNAVRLPLDPRSPPATRR